MRPPPHAPHAPRAFTLVELLLGSFLGALIATSVYKVFVSASSYYGRQL
ncbi:MAG: prepilin-type N-terminal cleavage/methylation domain-containing protein, partial [Deltaproteobacteria bacterium]|nr:prepilin-type N-terminal cleavage/methylation domain-containing protein [Deltaproteobacteria bacterium]